METDTLTNSDIAELLATEAQTAKQPLQKALRRAARRAFIWPEEAAQLLRENRSLQELSGVGPSLEKLIHRWIERAPQVPEPPEIRCGFFTMAEAHTKLLEEYAWSNELKGDLQMHTRWSDGWGSVEQMAQTAAARRYEYIAVTDHSMGLKIAGGMNAEQLGEQASEIAAVNQDLETRGESLRVLHSIELNLDPHGEGDMPEDALSRLDFVLGSFHSALRRKDDQTERYLAALRNPAIQIIGHPRGRIYNYRLGLTADWQRVFELAAALDKAVEIDAYPDRQDLSNDLVKLAAEAGCRISLGTDSHAPSDLAFIDLALVSALHGGIRRERILNFMTREQLLCWAATVRSGSGTAAC